MTERITLAISKDTQQRLMKRMKYGDSFNKALNDLLDFVEKMETRYTSDKVTLEDKPEVKDNER